MSRDVREDATGGGDTPLSLESASLYCTGCSSIIPPPLIISDDRYRTSPLNGLWTHTKGGFYHDGRFATLLDVVNHYDSCFNLGLADQEKGDLVEYLKSLPNDGHQETEDHE